MGSGKPLLCVQARIKSAEHDAVGEECAFGRVRGFFRQHQVFEMLRHEAPVVVNVELDVEASGMDVAGLFASGEEVVPGLGVEVQDARLKAITVIDEDGLGRGVVFGDVVNFVFEGGVEETAGPAWGLSASARRCGPTVTASKDTR